MGHKTKHSDVRINRVIKLVSNVIKILSPRKVGCFASDGNFCVKIIKTRDKLNIIIN